MIFILNFQTSFLFLLLDTLLLYSIYEVFVILILIFFFFCCIERKNAFYAMLFQTIALTENDTARMIVRQLKCVIIALDNSCIV